MKSLATSILGKAASSFLDPMVLGFLGTGDSSDLAAYLDKIEGQLAEMQGQLRQLQDSVDLIVRALPIIEEQFEDVDMQNKLDAVNRTSASITTNFETYVNAVHALSASDAARAKEAAREIFELMDVINLKSVAENMTVLQDLFIAPNAQAKGSSISSITTSAKASSNGPPTGNTIAIKEIHPARFSRMMVFSNRNASFPAVTASPTTC